MGRTANTPAQPTSAPELLPAAVERIEAAQDLALSHDQNDAVLSAGIDIGRLEALDFILTVSNSAILPIYENVKKSKAWRYLRNPKSSHGKNFQSLEEFCEVKLGKSYKRLQALAANRSAIGHEAFEQAEKMGLRQVDYNAIKTLPAPDQELVRRAVEEAQSRDEVLDLLQELAGRHAKEKEALTKEAAEARAEKQAVEKVLQTKNQQIDKLQLVQVLPPEELYQEIKKKASSVSADALGAVRGGVRQALIAVKDAPGEGPSKTVFMAALVGQLQAELNALREEFNLPDVSSAADQELAAEVAQWAGQ